MNFKTIFSVTLFALLSTVKAAPVADYNIHDAYPTLPVLNETYEDAKKGCSAIAAELFVSSDKSSYACLQLYMPDREFKLITPKDGVCFYANDRTTCVNSKYSNIEECSITSDKYNYDSCMKKLINGPLFIPKRFRDFNTKEKILSSPIIDSTECKSREGSIFLLEGPSNYACIETDYVTRDPVTEGVCVEVKKGSEKTNYCVIEENTSIKECVHDSESYDYRECARKLVKLGEKVPYTVSAYNYYGL